MDAADRFRHFLEYAFARSVIGFFGLLPEGAGRRLGRVLGRAAGALLRSRSRRAAENLRAAFPEAPEAQVAAWVRGLWENLGTSLWEFARIPDLTPESFFRGVEARGLEGLRASYSRGKGVVLFGAHVGNWEWVSVFMAFAGLPTAAVARRMRNPFFDDYLTRLRARHGVTMLGHRNAVREGLRWLKEGKVLGLLIDQRITAGGTQVPFFGRPAHTTTMAALLAHRRGAAVHGIHSRRENGRMTIVVDPEFDLSRFNGDAASATAAMTAEVERWVRESPAQWLWIHNRWKP